MSLVASELVFMVRLIRMATREHIRPLEVTTPRPPEPQAAYEAYVGARVEVGTKHRLIFSAADAQRPFLMANAALWKTFEPELRRRLTELNADATMSERVHSCLLEALPAGQATMASVANKLAVSTRTLQRRLRSESTSFQQVLSTTREQLARHYLARSSLSCAEISFLLGFADPNSFFRAFYGWTGQTPESMRMHESY